MSLQGSLETFALPDVMVLLASTKKDGELRVVGSQVDGRVWLNGGRIVQTSVSDRATEAVEGVFELLRLDKGSFSFDGDSSAPDPTGPQPVEGVLAQAQLRLAEWKDIAKVVPHLDAVVDMAAEAPGDEVRVTAAQWTLLRTVAGGRAVRGLMADRGTGEFDTCRTVKELVDAGLASIDVGSARRPAAASAPAGAAAGAPARSQAAAPAAPSPQGPMQVNGMPRDPSRYRRPVEAEEATPAARADQAPAPERPRRMRPAQPGTGPGAPSGRPEPEDARALVAQLAAAAGEDEEKVARQVADHLASGGQLPEVASGDEPINRGLLLKFLSSVRN